jgi:hypothetical protein
MRILYSRLVSRWRQTRTGCTETQNFVYDTEPQVTHLVPVLLTGCTAGNPTTTLAMPSVDGIGAIAEVLTEGDAIVIAQAKIEYLDELSIEGDIPDNVSDIEEVRQKDLFTGN